MSHTTMPTDCLFLIFSLAIISSSTCQGKKKKKIREQVVALLFPPLSVSETQSCYLSRPTNVTAKWREKEGEKMDKSWVDTLLNQPQSGDEA